MIRLIETWWRVVATAWLVALGASCASAQGLAAVAADGHIWVVRTQPAEGERPAQIVVYHAADGADHRASPPELQRLASLPGELAMRDLAARGSSVILPMRDGTLHRLWVERTAVANAWEPDSALLARLPATANLRALAAADDTAVWAIVRQAASEAIPVPSPTPNDAPGTPDALLPSLAQVLDLPEGAMTTAAPAPAASTDASGEPLEAPEAMVDLVGKPVEEPPTSAQPDAGQAVTIDRPVDVLLARRGGRWVAAPLPEDWPVGQPAWMLLEPGSERPMLVTVPPRAAGDVWVYEPSATGPAEGDGDGDDVSAAAWQKHVITLDRSDHRLMAVLDVAEQMVLVWQSTRPQEGVSVAAAVLRQGRLIPVADTSLDVPPGTPWAVLSAADQLVLLGQPSATPETLQWRRLTLQGQAAEPEAVPLVTPDPMAEMPGMVLHTGVLLLVMGLLLMFWRRDAATALLQLPRGVALADLPRRTLAGLIDLLPPLGVVMAGFGYGAEAMYRHWPTSPGPGMTWPGMLPGVLVILGFLAHTTAAEVFTGQSLGKRIMRLRVANLLGQRPTRAQLLSRSLLKILDVIAWLPLVLPLIGPYRQRLGDIVARTVVVSGTPTPDTPPESEARDE